MFDQVSIECQYRVDYRVLIKSIEQHWTMGVFSTYDLLGLCKNKSNNKTN